MSTQPAKEDITREEAIEALRALHGAGDIELAHGEADDILCKLLNALGYDDVVVAYDKVPKWFA